MRAARTQRLHRRLKTVTETYPLYSKSDQALLAIGDAYAGEAHNVRIAPNLPGAIRERLASVYEDGRSGLREGDYPLSDGAHVEDARDRLVIMNRQVPEPTQAAIARADAEERSRQALHFTDKTLGLIKRGPTVVEAVHVGEPSLNDPSGPWRPDVTNENKDLFLAAVNAGKPAAPAEAVTPTSVNEPPRNRPAFGCADPDGGPAGGTGVGAEIVSAPSGTPQLTPMRW